MFSYNKDGLVEKKNRRELFSCTNNMGRIGDKEECKKLRPEESWSRKVLKGVLVLKINMESLVGQIS